MAVRPWVAALLLAAGAAHGGAPVPPAEVAAPTSEVQVEAHAEPSVHALAAEALARAVAALHMVHGEASWYGPGFHGRRTASGERFDREELTAAHRSLPFGTRVRVENLRTGHAVDVRINDRGPFHKRRIIDLSEAAGRMLGLKGRGAGVAPVRIIVLPREHR